METTRKTIQTGAFTLSDKDATGCLDVLAENFIDYDDDRLAWLLNRERHQTGRAKSSVVMCFGGKALKFTQAYPTSSTVHVKFEKDGKEINSPILPDGWHKA